MSTVATPWGRSLTVTSSSSPGFAEPCEPGGDRCHAVLVVTLKEATPSDLEALVEVQRTGAVAALAHIFDQQTYPFPTDQILARWTAHLADPVVRAYVVGVGGGRIVGFAATRGSELLHFGTAKDTWGTGVAAAAHDLVLDRLWAEGVPHAWLRVFQQNHRARRFYEKVGWSRTDQVSRSPFAPHPVLVHYTRDLVDSASGNRQTSAYEAHHRPRR